MENDGSGIDANGAASPPTWADYAHGRAPFPKTQEEFDNFFKVCQQWSHDMLKWSNRGFSW